MKKKFVGLNKRSSPFAKAIVTDEYERAVDRV